jgi:recombination protein RecA
MVNIVGDKSSGKTLMAIEATANFLLKYPKGRVRYAEVESAFDTSYAAALGMPVDKVEFPDNIFTVEDLYEDLERVGDDAVKTKQPTLYVIDSYDALSDRAELARKIDEGTYGGNKAKTGSQMFRRVVQKLETGRVTLLIISQVRDNIGVTFGNKLTRTGGRSLDFYASQVLWLAEIGKLKRTIRGVERIYGVDVKANCKKNKVGLPFRVCEYPIVFGYGVDDVSANVNWLQSIKRLDSIGFTDARWKQELGALLKLPDHDFDLKRKQISAAVVSLWSEIEQDFLPTRGKYR